MKRHCRCRKCGARKTLDKHPDHYERQPKCWSCKERNWRIDKWADARPWRDPAKLCHCDGVWFSIKGAPHRKGTAGCNYPRDDSNERESEYANAAPYDAQLPGVPDF